MFQWARNLIGLGGKQAAAAPAAPAIRGRYDNAITTPDNQRKWWMVDYLSAKSANNYQVRRQLRMRSRYEVSNNPYLFGVANSNADDLIGTGPTLQVMTSDKAANRQIERAWQAWCEAVGFAEKLRTAKLAKTVDGEGFLVLKTVKDLDSPVTLYPVDIEADQVTTYAPHNLQELWVDGLILHPVTGRPVAYDILRSHPGDYFFPNLNPLAQDRIPARFVCHWFPKFRPGQVRGVPVFTPALDLFTELRAFRKAVLGSAQIAASFAALLKTNAPLSAGDDPQAITPFTTAPIDHGVMTILPGGVDGITQMDPKQPTTSYRDFQEKCLAEALRPLSYPLNLAMGTSESSNFSSARLDIEVYRRSLQVERVECERIVMNPVFAAWFDEAVMVPGLLPSGITLETCPYAWHWPPFSNLDPVVDADADHSRLSNGTLTRKEFWASRGRDWQEVMAQQKLEQDEIEKMGLHFGEPAKTTVSESEDDKEPASAK